MQRVISLSPLDILKFKFFTQECKNARMTIVSAFLEDTPSLIADLEKSINDGLEHKTAKLTHKIKSSAALFCTEGFQVVMNEFERDVVQINTPEYLSRGRRLVFQLNSLLDEVLQPETFHRLTTD
jgi:HPt (histidine-containing phosphotransfer) domain-containing protein